MGIRTSENESAQHSKIGGACSKEMKWGRSIIIDSKVLLKRSKAQLCESGSGQDMGRLITRVGLWYECLTVHERGRDGAQTNVPVAR